MVVPRVVLNTRAARVVPGPRGAPPGPNEPKGARVARVEVIAETATEAVGVAAGVRPTEARPKEPNTRAGGRGVGQPPGPGGQDATPPPAPPKTGAAARRVAGRRWVVALPALQAHLTPRTTVRTATARVRVGGLAVGPAPVVGVARVRRTATEGAVAATGDGGAPKRAPRQREDAAAQLCARAESPRSAQMVNFNPRTWSYSGKVFSRYSRRPNGANSSTSRTGTTTRPAATGGNRRYRC